MGMGWVKDTWFQRTLSLDTFQIIMVCWRAVLYLSQQCMKSLCNCCQLKALLCVAQHHNMPLVGSMPKEMHCENKCIVLCKFETWLQGLAVILLQTGLLMDHLDGTLALIAQKQLLRRPLSAETRRSLIGVSIFFKSKPKQSEWGEKN